MNSNRRAFLAGAGAAAAAAIVRSVLAANDKHSFGLIASGGLGRATMAKAQWHWSVVTRLMNCPFLCTLGWNRIPGSEAGVCSMALRAAT